MKYRRSFLGLFWTLLSPISITLIYYFVFKLVVKVQVPHYLAFILSGVLPWAFFSQTLGEGMESITGSYGLISKVPIPSQIFPYVNAITNLSTLLFSIPVLIGASFLSHVTLGSSVVLLPVFFLGLFFLTYFLSLSLSLLFVYFRDLRHLFSIILQLWFYVTPVVYSENMIPEKFRFVLWINPLAGYFMAFHKILVEGKWPSVFDIASSVGWLGVIFVGSILFQKKVSQEIVERI